VSRGQALPAILRTFAALAAALALLAPSAAPVRAASVTFGTPTATFDYLSSIVFSVSYSASGPISSAELRILYPGATGPWITILPAPVVGSTELRYQMDLTGGAHIVPNTVLKATFAITTESGTDTSEPVTVSYQDTSHTWNSVTGSVVTVHWYSGSQSFGEQALRIAEKAISDTSALLGVTEKDPIDFYIYGDSGSFRDALGPGTRENVGGQAHASIRTLFALIRPADIASGWVADVVPHELTHLVFDTAVGNPFRFPPRWLNEGLAVYLSTGYGSFDRGLVRDAVKSGDLLPLMALTGMFPTDPDKTYLAYAEAVSAVDYLVKKQGREKLFKLVLAYKEGLTDDEAFGQALGMDVAGFQAGWLTSLGAATPEQYGPQPAPPGPVPPGWDQAPPDGSGGSPAPGASGAVPSPGRATPRPTARPVDGPSDQGSDTGLILLAVFLVAGVMLVGLVVASRRARAG
jgi:hypothetical protein